MITKFSVFEKNDLNQNFWKWFGNSKMVDDNGNPTIFYHGTIHKFDEFQNISSLSSNHFLGTTREVKSLAFFFTKDRGVAMSYAEDRREYHKKSFEDRNVIDVYLRMENPMWLTEIEESEKLLNSVNVNIGEELGSYDDSKYVPFSQLSKWEEVQLTDLWQLFDDNPSVIERIKKGGYDGVIIRDTWDDFSYIVFEPNQIKSASKNNGDYSKGNNSIYK